MTIQKKLNIFTNYGPTITKAMGLRFHHKIDMKAGFHLIRIALGHKKLTAFRYKFGLYEYIVMPFGLTNVPATFQYEINEML